MALDGTVEDEDHAAFLESRCDLRRRRYMSELEIGIRAHRCGTGARSSI